MLGPPLNLNMLEVRCDAVLGKSFFPWKPSAALRHTCGYVEMDSSSPVRLAKNRKMGRFGFFAVTSFAESLQHCSLHLLSARLWGLRQAANCYEVAFLVCLTINPHWLKCSCFWLRLALGCNCCDQAPSKLFGNQFHAGSYEVITLLSQLGLRNLPSRLGQRILQDTGYCKAMQLFIGLALQQRRHYGVDSSWAQEIKALGRRRSILGWVLMYWKIWVSLFHLQTIYFMLGHHRPVCLRWLGGWHIHVFRIVLVNC